MNTAKRRILFIDRDGTLIIEPEDQQIDSLEKLELIPGVIPALLELKQAGYEFVIVSNQDGLGTDSYPTRDYEIPQQKMIDIFASQGITFSDVLIDPHFEHQNAPTRKPGIGLVLDYLKSGELDLADSWVIGDRETDLQLAENMGIGGLRIGRRIRGLGFHHAHTGEPPPGSDRGAQNQRDRHPRFCRPGRRRQLPGCNRNRLF